VLSVQALARHSERGDAWGPVAAAVCGWCADAAQGGLAPVDSIKAAETWLKAATDEIPNERLAPLAKQARNINVLRWCCKLVHTGRLCTGCLGRKSCTERLDGRGLTRRSFR
jgi:hypothetical protein